jgi:hypothetical protein
MPLYSHRVAIQTELRRTLFVNVDGTWDEIVGLYALLIMTGRNGQRYNKIKCVLLSKANSLFNTLKNKHLFV